MLLPASGVAENRMPAGAAAILSGCGGATQPCPRTLPSVSRDDANVWRYLVSPLSLLRERALSLEEMGAHRARALRGSIRRCTQMAQALPLILAPAMALIASTQVRHWLGEVMATVCVVGGF